MIIENPKCPDCGAEVLLESTVKETWTLYSVEDHTYGADYLLESHPVGKGDRFVCNSTECDWTGEPNINSLRMKEAKDDTKIKN